MDKLLQRLREERAAKFKNYEALRAKYGDKPPSEWESSDRSLLTELHERMIDIDCEIAINEGQQRQERFIASQTVGNEPTPATQNRGEAGDLLRQRIGEFMISTNSSDIISRAAAVQAEMQARAMQVDIPAQAGYFALPQTMFNEMIEPARRDFVLRRIARTLPPVPRSGGVTSELTGRPTANWGTELTSPTESNITAGNRTINPKDNVSFCKVSRPLLREWQSGSQFIISELAYAKGYLEEAAFVSGDGVTAPLGINTASAMGVPSSQNVTSTVSGGFKADDLIDLAMGAKIRPVYFDDPSAAFLMSWTALGHMRKLKDDEGQYIATPTVGVGDSLAKGASYTILGKPVYVSEFMPALASASLSVIFGAWRNYWIVDSIHQELQIVDQTYAATNQNGYFLRAGTDASAMKSDAFARLVTL